MVSQIIQEKWRELVLSNICRHKLQSYFPAPHSTQHYTAHLHVLLGLLWDRQRGEREGERVKRTNKKRTDLHMYLRVGERYKMGRVK